MLTPTRGRDKVLYFRDREATEAASGARLALQISHEIGETREMTTTQTKDGADVAQGGLTTVISLEALISSDDNVSEMLHAAFKAGHALDVWEVDLSTKGALDTVTSTYPCEAQYGVGYLDSWTSPADVSGSAQLSTNFNVQGELVSGLLDVPADDFEEASYVFRQLNGTDEVPAG